jgi:glycosyltransferase involved in cell wall biosynthesis
MESIKQSSLVLEQRGHRVEIISLDGPTDSWTREFPCTVHALGPGRSSYGYAPRFRRWLEERHTAYDAVIVHGLWQYNSFAVWRALRGTATPYFVFSHGMLDPWFNRTYPLKHFKKLLYWPWAEYRVLRDAAAVLFTSEEERRLARESFAPYGCHEVVVNYGTAAPNADLMVARHDFLKTFPQLREKRLLLFLGRLHEKKGCELLLEALAAIRNSGSDAQSLHLVMAGPCADDAFLRYLKDLAAKLPVTFSGMLSGQLKWGAFSAAEVFVLPSHQENFGIAVVEALACGTPVLISNKVNIWREVVASGAGFAEEDDRNGTIRLIEHWIDTPLAERIAMETKARDCFAQHFEINQAVDSLLQVLTERRRVG